MNYSKTMKRLFFCLGALAAMAAGGCSDGSRSAGTCRICGSVELERLEGVQIFLVPFSGPQDTAHVDSIPIRDLKFEFVTDTPMVAMLRLDYRHRMGVQELLVITEPGEVSVTIGPLSTCTGTPQNDSLQVWKRLTEKLNADWRPLNAMLRSCPADSAATIRARIDSLRADYRARSRQLCLNMGSGLLHDFLAPRFAKPE